MNNKTILDACCGSKMFWFDKKNPNVEFCDNRIVPRHEYYPQRCPFCGGEAHVHEHIFHEDRANYWIQVDPATVEQFIGLTDKYSKKMIFYERSMLL